MQRKQPSLSELRGKRIEKLRERLQRLKLRRRLLAEGATRANLLHALIPSAGVGKAKAEPK